MSGVSRTITLKPHPLVLPTVSVAVQATLLVPSEKNEPDTGAHTKEVSGQLSKIAGLLNVTTRLVWPVGTLVTMLPEQKMTGAGLDAVTMAVAELLCGLGSKVAELTVMALVIVVRVVRLQLAVATS